jgi:hypothetical protein
LKINFELNDIFSSETSNSKFEFELSDYEAVSKSFDSSKIS